MLSNYRGDLSPPLSINISSTSKLFFFFPEFISIFISSVDFLHYSGRQQVSREDNLSYVQAQEGCASLLGERVILASSTHVVENANIA